MVVVVLLLLEEELPQLVAKNTWLLLETLKDDVAKSNRQPFRDTMEVVSLKMTISAA
jgi:hypothetical protein